MRVLLDATAITHRPSGARTRLLSLYPRVARMEGVALTVMARAEAMAISLVLAGAPNPGYDQILQRRYAGLEGRPDAPGLHLLGPVSEEARTALLKSALLVVQPAKYEGFGMGVLEAMTVGIPLACSKIPAHEEVAGIGAALFFSRDSVADAAKALTQGALDYRLRGELVMQGKARAAEFSWDAAAEHLKVIWNNLVARSPHL